MGRLRLYVDERGRSAMHQSGFSWLAGIALVLWALRKRLYILAALSLVYGVGYNLVVAQLSPGLQLAALAIQFSLIGALANPLHRWILERRGWQLTAEEPEPASGKTT